MISSPMAAYENHQPKSGDSGIIKTEKIMDETEMRVARWADGNRSFSFLSLTSWRLSSRSPASRPEAINTGRYVPRAARAQSRTPAPVTATAFG